MNMPIGILERFGVEEDAVSEFTESRTHERTSPLPVDAYGFEPDIEAALRELTPSQRVAVAMMSLGQRKLAVRQALDHDTYAEHAMPQETRLAGERWLRAVSGAVKP